VSRFAEGERVAAGRGGTKSEHAEKGGGARMDRQVGNAHALE
jgi:hypothetical protein